MRRIVDETVTSHAPLALAAFLSGLVVEYGVVAQLVMTHESPGSLIGSSSFYGMVLVGMVLVLYTREMKVK